MVMTQKPDIDNMKISAIYKIINNLNGKIYIGGSCNFDKRHKEHRNTLIKKKHHSIYLQRAWNKYGGDAFSFEIIERCDPKDLLIREQFYLDKFKSYNREFGYNMAREAQNINYGRACDEKHLKRLSDSHLGNKTSEETKQKIKEAKINENFKKTYSLLNPKKEIITFTGICEFCRSNGLFFNNVRSLLTGKINSYNGWERATTELEKPFINYKSKISLTNPSGEVISRESKRAFCSEFSLDRAAIGRVLSGKSRSYKGWKKCGSGG